MEKLDLRWIEAGSVISFGGVEVILQSATQVFCRKEEFAQGSSIEYLSPKEPVVFVKRGERVIGPTAEVAAVSKDWMG